MPEEGLVVALAGNLKAGVEESIIFKVAKPFLEETEEEKEELDDINSEEEAEE